MEHKRKKTDTPRYDGSVLNKVSGLNPSTRRAWTFRGVLRSRGEAYDFENLLRAAAGAEVARHGIARAGTRDRLLDIIVDDMLSRVSDSCSAPAYLVACPPPDPENGGPVADRVLRAFKGDATVHHLADGDGLLCIATGLSSVELAQHFASMADAGEVASFALDTAGLLRRTLDKLKALGQPVPSDEQQP